MVLCKTENGLQVRSHGQAVDREWPRGRGNHPNSKAAFVALDDLGKRQRAVYNILLDHGPMTDREVLDILDGHDMNQVRPRITELIHAGWVQELGRVSCAVTGRPVRRVKALTQQARWNAVNQMELSIPTH